MDRERQVAISTLALVRSALLDHDFGALDGMHLESWCGARMVVQLVGRLICQDDHPRSTWPCRENSYGRPRTVASRPMPFDVANAPKRTLCSAAGRQTVFNGGPVAVAAAGKDEEPPRVFSEIQFNFKRGERAFFFRPVFLHWLLIRDSYRE